MNKTNINVKPRDIFEHERTVELCRAIVQAYDAGLSTNFEWYVELSELIARKINLNVCNVKYEQSLNLPWEGLDIEC